MFKPDKEFFSFFFSVHCKTEADLSAYKQETAGLPARKPNMVVIGYSGAGYRMGCID